MITLKSSDRQKWKGWSAPTPSPGYKKRLHTTLHAGGLRMPRALLWAVLWACAVRDVQRYHTCWPHLTTPVMPHTRTHLCRRAGNGSRYDECFPSYCCKFNMILLCLGNQNTLLRNYFSLLDSSSTKKTAILLRMFARRASPIIRIVGHCQSRYTEALQSSKKWEYS